MTERDEYTPSLGAIRTWYALDRAVNGEDREFEQGIKEFDRALRKHDAALIESLADSWENTDEDGPHVWNGETALWLREKARERREGVS